MEIKEKSPFTPGNPVPVEFFVGRSKLIEELIRYAKQSTHGKQENIFLIGDRGIGKSSLASFLNYYVNNHMNVLGIHVFLGKGVYTLEDMVQQIFDQLLKQTVGQSWYNKISAFFGKHIKEIGLFGVTASFKPPKDDLKELVRNFPEALYNLLQKIKDDKAGILIALDDINGLVSQKEFANWYKSFVDEIATKYKTMPVYMILIGLPDQREIISNLQPSLMRIFRIAEIDRLTDDEVRDFIKKSFQSVEIKIEDRAVNVIVKYCSGLPILMHEIGDAIFWLDKDGYINNNDAIDGVFSAAEKVGQKYLDPRVYKAIRSERYRSILNKLGDLRISRDFRKKEIKEKLTVSENKVFNNFLRKMRNLGVIELDKEKGKGAYKYTNEIYPLYIKITSLKSK